MSSGGKVKLHRTVLSRCLPTMVRDLDFKAVFIYIYQQELFDDITLRDISEQRLTSDKTRELVLRLQQRDQDTYIKFKQCLVQSKQEYLKDILEKEETKLSTEMNQKQEVQHTGTDRETKSQESLTKAVGTSAPVTIENVVISVCDETLHDSGKHPDVYDRAALWMKFLSEIAPSQTQTTVGPPASKREYLQHSEQQQPSNYHLQSFQQAGFNDLQSKKRSDIQHEELMEIDGFIQQTANDRGIYERVQTWYDLVFGRKTRGYNPTVKTVKQEMSENPVMEQRDITEEREPLRQSVILAQSGGPIGLTATQKGGNFTTGGDNSGQCATVGISDIFGGKGAKFDLGKISSDKAGCGPVICSSGMQHSKSTDPHLEGRGREGSGVLRSTPDLSSVSFIDGKIVLKEHYDVCIIFSDKDEDDAYIFIEHLESIDLGGGGHPKICRFNDEGIWGLATRIDRVRLVCTHCSVIFVFLSQNFFSDSYTRFFQDEVVMSTLKNVKVRPVLSKEDCTLIPTGLQNIQPIKWYRRDTRAYQENMKSILDYCRKARLLRENNGVQTILPDL